jgi:hypothetical protein
MYMLDSQCEKAGQISESNPSFSAKLLQNPANGGIFYFKIRLAELALTCTILK